MEAILFIGIQASGKSTFYRERFFRTHLRINLDMLRTRHRERVVLEACLSAQQRFVIDNTNPCQEDRARYIGPAKSKGYEVIGYYFQSKLKPALRRNAQREGSEEIPEKGIRGTYARLELPTYEEGFDKLYYVVIKPNNTFSVEEWQDEV